MTTSTALRLTGADALALLHRISTNALGDLGPGRVRPTLFCDFRGRLLHRAVVGVTADGAVWLVRDDAPGADLAAFLDRHVFRDDVRIEDRSGDLPVRLASGDAGLAPGTLADRDGVPMTLGVAAGETLSVGGAAGTLTPDARQDAERSRIRAGRAAHGHEIAEAFTPFEVGLAHEVHLDKGCFTGQEVLMRLITYKSVRRRLARAGGAGAAPAVPADLTADGGPAGVLTSAVAEDGAWIGLAVVRGDALEPPRTLRLPDGTEIGSLEALAASRPQGRG
jgi:tRNA-modifying protein YgfZ